MSSNLLSDDPYQVLGLSHSASATEIKSRYRQLILKVHPDRVSGDEAAQQRALESFHQLQTAYEIIGDENRRARHDAKVRLARLRAETIGEDEHRKTYVSYEERYSTEAYNYTPWGIQRSPSARPQAQRPTKPQRRYSKGHTSQASSCSSTGSAFQADRHRSVRPRHGRRKQDRTGSVRRPQSRPPKLHTLDRGSDDSAREKMSRVETAGGSSHNAVMTWLHSVADPVVSHGAPDLSDKFTRFDRIVMSETLSSPLRLENLAWRHGFIASDLHRRAHANSNNHVAATKAAPLEPHEDVVSGTRFPIAPGMKGLPDGVGTSNHRELREVPRPSVSTFETTLASNVSQVLRWFRPKFRPGHTRYEWICSCGKLIYADYDTVSSDSQQGLGELLVEAKPAISSFAHLVGDRKRYIMLSYAYRLQEDAGNCFNFLARCVLLTELVRRFEDRFSDPQHVAERSATMHQLNVVHEILVSLFRDFAIALLHFMISSQLERTAAAMSQSSSSMLLWKVHTAISADILRRCYNSYKPGCYPKRQRDDATAQSQ
jgi:curved DNA-binding protein CbpA